MTWTVQITAKARKQAGRLPGRIQAALRLLIREVQESGPARANWHHYGKLKGMDGMHHCHLNKGKPRYVAVWKEVDNGIHIVEIRYVGTHEKAPY